MTADFATNVILAAASVGVGPGMLTEGNAALLLANGNAAQRDIFAQRELTGEWTGTMCLSESEASSSLSDITPRALPDGPASDEDPLGPRYRLTGNTMRISAGEHDLAENIVHIVANPVAPPRRRRCLPCEHVRLARSTALTVGASSDELGPLCRQCGPERAPRATLRGGGRGA